MKENRYEAFIDDISHCYDGDTVTSAHFKIADARDDAVNGEIYPDIFVMDGGIWVHTSIRLLGIDCPEFHPHHRLPSGEPRDPQDIEWEHQLATEARDELRRIISANDLKFVIGNPVEGKYAGRIVAEVWAPDPEHGQLINVSKRLLTMGLAYEYDGGTKQIWTRPAD